MISTSKKKLQILKEKLCDFGYDDVIVPYNQLIPELKPMFSEAIRFWEGHISNIR